SSGYFPDKGPWGRVPVGVRWVRGGGWGGGGRGGGRGLGGGGWGRGGLAGEVAEDGLHLGGRGLGGVQGKVRDGRRGEVEGGEERRGVADLVLVAGFGAPGQTPDQLVRWQVQPDQGGFGRQAERGAGPGRWVRPFGTKGCDQDHRPARPQVRG